MSVSRTDQSRFLSPGRDGTRIIRVGPEQRYESIRRLVADHSTTDTDRVSRFLEYAEESRISLDWLWSRINEAGRITQTVLAVPNPGRTAMFFASAVTQAQSSTSIGELINHAASAMDFSLVHLAQTLVDPADQKQRESFLAGGFSELTRLSYLDRAVPTPRQAPATPNWPSDVQLVPYRADLDRELFAILELTYENTLDCPELRGLRDTQDILVGHRSTGAFDPSLWTILRIKGKGAGALLLNPSPVQQTIELVYLGLSPKARGRGLGRMLLHHGLRQTSGRSERRINLAVDERNAPALNLYRAEGFQRALRRIAMIRSLRTPAQ